MMHHVCNISLLFSPQMRYISRKEHLPYFLLAMFLWTVWSLVMLFNPEISNPESYSRAIARIAALLVPSALFLFFNPEFRKERNPILPIAVGALIGLAYYLFHVIADVIPNKAILPTTGAIWLNWIIGSPFAEELFFRGVILRQELQSRSAWGAIPISAICFTLFHLPSWIIVQQQPITELLTNGFTIFIYGIVFGLIYWLAKSILSTFIPHATNNLIAQIINPL